MQIYKYNASLIMFFYCYCIFDKYLIYEYILRPNALARALRAPVLSARFPSAVRLFISLSLSFCASRPRAHSCALIGCAGKR